MIVSGFEWDEGNILHIERHRYTPEEVEEVFCEGCKIVKTRNERYIGLGETFSGRLAFVVFEEIGRGRIRVVTARDMELSERRLYRRK